MASMDSLYRPELVEKRWQQTWEQEGLYRAGAGRRRDETFVVALPPPNVTGNLHMGHALNASTQDVLVRWHRMRGFDTLWQPGYDHASISVHAVIERQLLAEGTNRFELGRDAFVERTWRWLEEYGGIIMGQLRRIGASVDYSRERFTMDEAYVRAVYRFFVHLYERGLIYRDNRVVNWCPGCGTSVSDLEVDHRDVDDALVTVRYPVAPGSGSNSDTRPTDSRRLTPQQGRESGSPGGISVATVRPATILADVAVAVHPGDERYRDLVGTQVMVPLVGRAVPVIADERVDPDFGTGALKITPGHDPIDFEIGRDHGLPEITVIGLNGRMNEEAGDLAGLTQAEASERILAWLAERGQLEGRASYRHSVGHCNRSGDRIEPLITEQWYCDMTELAAPAIAAVRDGIVRFTPPNQAGVALEWLENIRPWNISRQLWWGQQIPGLDVCGGARDRSRVGAGEVPGVRPGRARAGPRRLRHLVLVGALADRDIGLARCDARARALLPDERALHRSGHHLPLGRTHDDGRERAAGGDALPRRDHPFARDGPRRPAHVEEPWNRDRA